MASQTPNASYSATALIAELQRTRQVLAECQDALLEADDFVGNYVGVNDGDDGRPRPNRAMSLQQQIQAALAQAERVR